MKLILRLVLSAVAFWVAAELLAVEGPLRSLLPAGDGIVLADDRFSDEWFFTLFVVAAVFGIVNAILHPVIKSIGCAAYALTFGLLAIVVNALLLFLTSWIAHRILELDFEVRGFWTAFLGAVIIGLVTWLLGRLLNGGGE